VICVSGENFDPPGSFATLDQSLRLCACVTVATTAATNAAAIAARFPDLMSFLRPEFTTRAVRVALAHRALASALSRCFVETAAI